jgi:prepilin-type N-terminal cleavage/methylation domain-containing protein
MRNTRRAFTLIELLVVIAIIAILAGIAFPVFSTVQERARSTQDLSNLRQLGIGMQTYLNDNDNVIPTGIWMTALHPKYLPAWKIFQSPFDSRAPQENDTTAPLTKFVPFTVIRMLLTPRTDDGGVVDVTVGLIVTVSSAMITAPLRTDVCTVDTPTLSVTFTDRLTGWPKGTALFNAPATV